MTPDTITLVRHGETVGDSRVRLYGGTDIALSDLGRSQMRRVAARLAADPFSAAWTSPLARASESARIVLDGRPVPLSVAEGLREIHFGVWEGLTLEEARAQHPDVWVRWGRDGDAFAFPGGDQRAAFRARVAAAVRATVLETPGDVVAILHKGVIKVALATILGISATEAHAMPVHLGSIHRLRRSAGGWTLVVANEVAHLGPNHVPE